LSETPSEYDVVLQTVAAPVPTLPPQESVLDLLEDDGARFEHRDRAALIIESALAEFGQRRAFELLAELIRSLPGGRRGDELKVALIGGMSDETFNSLAKEHGIARQTFHRSVHRLRSHIQTKLQTKNG
jgi:hypothetical protein